MFLVKNLSFFLKNVKNKLEVFMENDIFYLKKLREFRKRKNLTQEEMSKILNLGSTTYKNYENKITEPSIDTLVKLADYFHISLDELVGRPTENVNLNALSENEAYLIRKILQMNDREIMRTKAFVMGLTED